MKIVLTGSLGHISKPLAQALLAKKHDITVISSNPDKQSGIEALGAAAAIGSLEDVSFLSKTFTGADAVYCMVPPDYTRPDQVLYYESLANIYAHAIRQSGVTKAITLSSYGAHLPSGTGFIIGSYRMEQIFNAIPGLTVTHMRPTFFYYNLLMFIDMIKAAGFIGAVYGGEDSLTMVSPNDIAAAIAEEITLQNPSAVRYVASDDRPCNEVAAVIGNAIGMPGLEWRVLPKEQVLQALIQHGMPVGAANGLVELGDAIHSGKLREDYDRHPPVLGQVKLEQYASEFAAAFNNK